MTTDTYSCWPYKKKKTWTSVNYLILHIGGVDWEDDTVLWAPSAGSFPVEDNR